MFKVQGNGTDQIDLTLDGKITRPEMQAGLERLFELSEGMRAGRMLYRIENFEFPEWSALVMEVRYIPRLFSLLSRFDRCAVITDQEWIAKAARVEGALLPGLDIRTFAPHEASAAQDWLDTRQDRPA